MEFFKKNGFWIFSFVLVAAMIGTWFYATGALKAATDSRVGTIKGADSSASGILNVEAEPGTKAHPNTSTQDGMNEKLEKLSQSVLVAWQQRYDAQKEILKWDERSLGSTFVSEFGKYSPPETWPEEDKGDSVKIKSLLDLYRQQVPAQMKEICSVIQTNWQFQEQLDKVARRNDDSGSGEETDDESDEDEAERTVREIVKWNVINQQLWLNKLSKFQGRDDNQFQINRPTPSQVYMLQQDLWLLEAMFDIIRTVNAQYDENGQMKMGPDNQPMMVQANDLAPVKEIDHVVFGREALALLGEIKDTITAANANDKNTGLASRNSRSSSAGRTRSKSSDAQLTYIGQPAFHGRYVDSNLVPIEAATIRKVLTEKTLPTDNLELIVAKRVPVRLAVQMDERKIPDFLAACANSPFAFEVWQVRINKHNANESIKLRGSEGAESEGNRGGGGANGGLGGPSRGGFGGGAAGGGAPSPRGKTTIALRENFDVGVEFYGIVKIYNPVNEELLTGKKAEETATP